MTPPAVSTYLQTFSSNECPYQLQLSSLYELSERLKVTLLTKVVYEKVVNFVATNRFLFSSVFLLYFYSNVFASRAKATFRHFDSLQRGNSERFYAPLSCCFYAPIALTLYVALHTSVHLNIGIRETKASRGKL